MEEIKIDEDFENSAEQEPISLVYSREEYAKKEFWDDRFKESKGFFDWYANWKEIKPSFYKFLDPILSANINHY